MRKISLLYFVQALMLIRVVQILYKKTVVIKTLTGMFHVKKESTTKTILKTIYVQIWTLYAHKSTQIKSIIQICSTIYYVISMQHKFGKQYLGKFLKLRYTKTRRVQLAWVYRKYRLSAINFSLMWEDLVTVLLLRQNHKSFHQSSILTYTNNMHAFLLSLVSLKIQSKMCRK